MRNVSWLLTIAVIITMLPSAYAAKRLGPPIEDLQSAPERVRIVVAEVREEPGNGKILFAVSEQLTGESPEQILLRSDAASSADVTVGSTYIVAWTPMRRNRNVIGGWETDPSGPSTVNLLGLGSTALFEATPELRYLFEPGVIADKEAADRQLEALLRQLQREDVRSRGLVIFELYLRPDLTARINAQQATILGTVLRTATLDPQHRDFLLRTALRLPAEFASPWLAEEFRRIIIMHGTQYDLSSFVPGLVSTAAQGLGQTGEPADIELLDTLLYSNNPGVSKAALDALDRLDSAAAVARAKQALERGWIHSETRFELTRYLGRPRS